MFLFKAQLAATIVGLVSREVLAFGRSNDLHHVHERLREKRLLINSFSEPISVTGEHAFQPPGEGDQRGPCPGLNALANHGYIPRNGVVSLLGAVGAMNDVFGISLELAALLAVMGVVWTGNPVSLDPSFSIGGNTTEVQNLLGNLLGLLGEPRGIDHSHNFIEADSSPTRDDLYVTGDPVTMNLTKFETLYDLVPEGTNQTFTLEVMSDFAAIRWNETIPTNPYFYYGPITGLLARNTGYCFIGNLFANYSLEHPNGALTHDILRSFFAVTGDRSNFTYTKGHERIPENWYKRTVDYGLVELNLDVVYFITRYPVFASVGGNTGKVNTFTGVDLSDPVGGLLNVPNLLQGNNLLCFVLELVNFAAPNYLNNLVTTLAAPVELLASTIAGPLLNLSCPELGEITRDGVPLWESLGAEFPGANRSGSAM
ncbi:Aromatic peroxygenase [Lecanosticta acicola]|uniref:Aromatic peroxygenase n=1 Tax=Lecanosticta acicola TaxID=111012 RepID=A0AAI8Z4C6_9PEZI|nr:Aromatic peroxygenase [Lecanosticta acicola]